MEKEFFIIMGKPGSGKGTQAYLLKSILEKDHAEVIHATTGGSFREFIKAPSFVSEQARNIQNSGGLQPEFLAIWNWANIFINSLKANTTVILDGAPRKLVEVEVMHELFPFLGYKYPPIIYIDVSDEWAKDRMKHRELTATEKREDQSNDEEITRRVDLFNRDILPCVEQFKNDSRYSFIQVNGEQTIEEVHAEVMQKLHEIRH